MQFLLNVKMLGLLTVANGTPVVAKWLRLSILDFPIDRGARMPDGQPLLGKSKTVRGIVLAIPATTACGLLLGIDWRLAALVGGAAMTGDVGSSFLKRRLRLPASSRASGLDQIPESLLPLLVCRASLSLTPPDIVTIVASFMIGEMLLSRALFAWHVRDRPY